VAGLWRGQHRAQPRVAVLPGAGLSKLGHYKSEWLFGNADLTGCTVRNFSKQRDGKSGVKPPQSKLEGEFQAELGGEGDAYCGAGAEEVAEGAGGYTELVGAGDRGGLGAGRVEAEGGGVAEIVDGSGEGGNVAYVIIAGILAVEEIEEFGEGAELDTLAKEIDVAADAEIHLVEGSAAELV